MKSTIEKLRIVKVILRSLEEEPKRWTQLKRAVFDESGTDSKFRSALKFVLQQGYVEHPERRGPYTLTEKGRRAIEVL